MLWLHQIWIEIREVLISWICKAEKEIEIRDIDTMIQLITSKLKKAWIKGLKWEEDTDMKSNKDNIDFRSFK